VIGATSARSWRCSTSDRQCSLADIQGGIGAGIDDGGWIDSYLIAEIVVIPLMAGCRFLGPRLLLPTPSSSWCSPQPARSRRPVADEFARAPCRFTGGV